MITEQEHSLAINGRIFRYVYRPIAPEKPLLVVLHGHNKSPRASKLKSEKFNVLCPIDSFGLKGYGSWYLGEGGDFFWLDALPEIIKSLYSGPETYFIGSSMGGYGAILHGILNNAHGVYANIPQTRLLGSTYANQGMGPYFRNIFGEDTTSRFNNLNTVVNSNISTYFDLAALRWDKENYLKQQILEFVDSLTTQDVDYSLEVFQGEGHGLTMPLHLAAERLLERTKLARQRRTDTTNNVPADLANLPIDLQHRPLA